MATKPLTIPNVFASEGTGTPNNIPLLDADFTQVANYFNDGSFFSTRGVDTGAANAYVVTLPSGYVPSAYNVGMRLVFNPGASNTGASTINVNALGSQTILTANGSALSGGEITAGYDCDLVYDGTNFRVLSLSIPQVTSVRLRSFNSVGNPDFGVDQISVGSTISVPVTSTKYIDRWLVYKAGTLVVSVGQNLAQVLLPNTSFGISRSFYRFTLTTQESSLGGADGLFLYSTIEGPQLRELLSDLHSVSLLVRSSVAGLKFGLSLRDPVGAYSLTALGTIPNANSWTLVTWPALPVWTGSVAWTTAPGNAGYIISITLAAGSAATASSNLAWNAGNFTGAFGQSNFAASPVNSTFDIAFCQHEPGPVCTTLIDKLFFYNLQECQRYFCKSMPYGTAPGADSYGYVTFNCPVSVTSANPINGGRLFPVRMAKAPTMSFYKHDTGTGNQGYYFNSSSPGGAPIAFTGSSSNETALTAIYGNASLAGPIQVITGFTADTGW